MIEVNSKSGEVGHQWTVVFRPRSFPGLHGCIVALQVREGLCVPEILRTGAFRGERGIVLAACFQVA